MLLTVDCLLDNQLILPHSIVVSVAFSADTVGEWQEGHLASKN